jgi:two-component system, NtrC family, sensor kinase
MSLKNHSITDNPIMVSLGKDKNSELSSEANRYRDWRFWLNGVYAQMSIRQKISLPFILMFLATWFLGASAFGYYFSLSLEQKKSDEIDALGERVLKDIEKYQKQLELHARLLSENSKIIAAIESDTSQDLLQNVLPFKTSLSLDLIKIVDIDGNQLIDLRTPLLKTATLFDKIAISQAIHGVNLSSMIATETPNPYVFVGTAPIKSPEGVVGGVIVGYGISNDFLIEMSQGLGKDIVALHQDQPIASTLPNANQIQWHNVLKGKNGDSHRDSFASRPMIKELYINQQPYIAKTLVIDGLANTKLELLLLSPLQSLRQSQRRLWIAVGIFSLMGVAIASTMGYLIAGAISRPIKKVTDASAQLADGDLTIRVPAISGDELSQLAQGFNFMAEQIQERDRQLNLKMQELQDTLEKLSVTQLRLVQTEKMASLGQIVAGIAHELNNPVTFIYGNVEHAFNYIEDLLNLIYVYQQEYPEPTEALAETIEEIDLYFLIPDLKKILQSMKSGAERIKDIILDLRNFSRLDEADLKSVDLIEGLENTLKILQYRFKPQANRPEIQLVKDYQEFPLVECYAAQMNQVFMNILSNAIDALEMVANPMIKIQASLSENFQQVHLGISDNGCGIPEEIISKIFDPFFTTKPVGKGTGMGLAVSYQVIVDQHGGLLECFSKPGQGSKFLITLPIRHQHQKVIYNDISPSV